MTEETLFHEVLAQPPAQRAAFLYAACAGQPELRAAVEGLLAAYEGTDSLLDHPGRASPVPDGDGHPGRRERLAAQEWREPLPGPSHALAPTAQPFVVGRLGLGQQALPTP
jgi:hypothetical protein